VSAALVIVGLVFLLVLLFLVVMAAMKAASRTDDQLDEWAREREQGR
jgi:hypothetical protein